MSAQSMLDAALAQFDAARPYADWLRVVESDRPEVHEIVPLARTAGLATTERDGWLLLRVAGGPGNDEVWDGRDYRARRLDAYLAAFSGNDVIEAIFEKNIEGRPEKLLALQAMREQIKATHPKPVTIEDQEGGED